MNQRCMSFIARTKQVQAVVLRDEERGERPHDSLPSSTPRNIRRKAIIGSSETLGMKAFFTEEDIVAAMSRQWIRVYAVE